MNYFRFLIHQPLSKILQRLILWVSVSLNLYWFIFQPPAAVSRVRLGISLLAGLMLVVASSVFFNRPLLNQPWNGKRRGVLVYASLILTVLLYLGFPHPSMALFALSERLEVEFIPLDATSQPIEVTWLNNGITDVSYEHVEWHGNAQISRDGVRLDGEAGETLGLTWDGRGWGLFNLYLQGEGKWLVKVKNDRETFDYQVEGNPQFVKALEIPIGADWEKGLVLALLWLNVALSIGLLLYRSLHSGVARWKFQTPDWVFSTILPLVLALMIIPSWGLAFSTAANNRLYADDYCYLNALGDYGWWGAIQNFYLTINGRLMSHLLNFTVLESGTASVPLGPFIYLITLAGSLWFFMHALFPTTRQIIVFSLSVSLVFLTFIISTDKFQAIFWTLHAVIVSGGLSLLLLALGVWVKMPKDTPKSVSRAGLFFLAFLSAGFHETITILGGCIFVVLAWLEWRGTRQKGEPRKPPLALFGLAGILAGFALIVFSPGNLTRVNTLGVSTDPLRVLRTAGTLMVNNFHRLFGAMENGYGFPLLVVLLVFLVGLGSGFPLSFRLTSDLTPLQRWEKIVLIHFPLIVIIIMLIPSAFLGGYFPERSLFVPQTVLVIGCFLLGIWGGNTLKTKGITMAGGATLLVGIMIFTTAWISWQQLLDMNEQMRLHAAEFDAREQVIQQAILNGESEVTVAPYQYAFGIDIQPDPQNWLTQCIGEYYGIPVYLESEWKFTGEGPD